MRLAITGNIGSGKSTIRKKLENHPLFSKYTFVSFDELVLNLYSDPAFKAQVKELTGTDIKAEVSTKVFENPSLKKLVEQISSVYLNVQLKSYDDLSHLIMEVPLLYEVPSLLAYFDKSLAVYCSDAEQLRRTVTRDGISESKFQRIKSSQLPTSVKILSADLAYCTDAPTEAHFEKLVSELKQMELGVRVSKKYGPQVWKEVYEAYTEPHRHYHDLSHLVYLMGQYDSLVPCADPALELAILFHDICYAVNPEQYSLNEQHSAAWLVRSIRQNVPELQYSPALFEAAELILATKTHTVDALGWEIHPDKCAKIALFLDMDMSVLASDWNTYQKYTENVEKEFSSTIPSVQFIKGRLAFLEGLDPSKVFHTAVYKAKLPQLVANLNAEVSQLKTRLAELPDTCN